MTLRAFIINKTECPYCTVIVHFGPDEHVQLEIRTHYIWFFSFRWGRCPNCRMPFLIGNTSHYDKGRESHG